MLGNFIADRVKGKQYQDHAPEVAKGILLHRAIDSFTDDHPRMMRSKELLHPYHGKWAGVVIDIYNDHFLATDWERYSPQEGLEDFIERMERDLTQESARMSEQDAFILERMKDDHWLLSYSSYEGLNRAFWGLSRRTGASTLEQAVSTLKELEGELREEFRAFFPDLVSYVKEQEAYETDETGPPSHR